MRKSIEEKVKKMTKERISTFTKEVKPKLKNLIDARNKALESVKKADRLFKIDDEIKGYNLKIDSLRRAAAEAENHDSSIAEIIKIRQQVETLKEVREEIEKKILPNAKKRLDDANKALSAAAESIILEMAAKEKPAIAEQYKNFLASILSYDQGMAEFGRTILDLPNQHMLRSDTYLVGVDGVSLMLPE